MNLLHTNASFARTVLLVLSLSWFCASAHAQLEYRKVLSNAIDIKLPPAFKLMDENTLAVKYPPNNKPSEVYTNEAATINVAFKKTEQSLTNQNVFKEGKKLEQQLIRKGKVEQISSEETKANSNNIYVFSFYSNALDTKVYNVLFVFSLKGKMVIGSFNCTIALQNQWQVTAFGIIRSLK